MSIERAWIHFRKWFPETGPGTKDASREKGRGYAHTAMTMRMDGLQPGSSIGRPRAVTACTWGDPQD